MGSEVVLSYENIEITKTDLDCLKPYHYLNDKIINFYLKYMYRTLLNHEQQRRVHIFDSFFSEALDQMDQSRVVRWLRRVNIFEKDLILVPALIDEHWFLIVIRDAPSLAITDDHMANVNNPRQKRPRITIMDSMRAHAECKKPQLLKYLYDFFQSACVIQKNMSRTQIGKLSVRMPCSEADVKEQNNNFDCGICMLENAEELFINTFAIYHDTDPEVEFRLSKARSKRLALKKLIGRLAETTEIENAVTNSTRRSNYR